ncbi:signal peptidase I [Alkalibacter mobilis]|uniref:signal peptidase I n=1 Tax=Alkalibacter mobilis TaxID=2787712 RepID=UPI0018A0254D|nr:signal peptidase I [Alkalibacter mobilis]MBF7095826.1 signal peptidase I [Alkalibacter mobilis]
MKKEAKKTKGDLREWAESAVVAIILAVVIKLFVFEFVMVEGSSMNPTLNNGDRLMVTKIDYFFKEPDYGDVIILNYSDGVEFVKRIVAIGGDSVEIKDSKLYVNDKMVQESYTDDSSYPDYPKTTVPEGAYFVLGDNRDNSRDSRFADVGFVAEDEIVGKVFIRIYPFDDLGRIK